MNSAIFEGWVEHRRLSPAPHAFRYWLFMMYLDLDELDDVFKKRWFWSTRRRALAWFRREDHFGDADKPLDVCVRDKVERETGVRPKGPIRLLTNLKYFGYCFNPVSFYYCFDENDAELVAIIAEVNNTPWGERTLYVLPGSSSSPGHIEATPEKVMHVSPFMQMDIDYRWRMSTPRNKLSVFMQNSRSGKKIFNANLRLRRTEITGPSLARILTFHPFMTLKVILAIHWQALKLWIKGNPVYDHPDKHKTPDEHETLAGNPR